MQKFTFPTYHHTPRPIKNINDLYDEQQSFGERTADWVASKMGSWGFIIGQSIILLVWIILNFVAFISHWDPYPFILMNLILSTQAAFAAPIIMMSQNRQAEKDRLDAHNDYLINQKSEEEIRLILTNLNVQNDLMAALYQELQELKAHLTN
jgi:uncharacterized membrane protein